MNRLNQEDSDLLQRIANHLIFNASFLHKIGLYHGKMGAVLFFAHYAHYTSNELYNDFTGELLDEIYEDIHTELAIDFENGLCGIGWGVEYLLQNGFMDGDSDDILQDMDKRIMERDLRRIENMDVCSGLTGISYYIHTRLYSSCRKDRVQPFDTTYLADWNSVKGSILIPDNKQILQTIFPEKLNEEDFLTWDLGLNKGCIGKGLKMLLS